MRQPFLLYVRFQNLVAICLLIGLFLPFSGHVGAKDTPASIAPQERCQKILRNLWAKQGGKVMPKVVIEEIAEYGKPAEYDFKRKLIIIDPKAYELCMEMEDKGEDALAFLIAHELIHAYQHSAFNYSSPGFFVKTKTLQEWATGQKEQRLSMESKADIWGAILCYLCGYDVEEIIPTFISEIYNAFNLNEEDPLYDSKKERLEIAERAQQELNQSILLYEMANYLGVLQHHDKDTLIYQYLINDFKSAEFYNNLGLAYIQLALPKLEDPFRSCPYPLTLDTETRLEKAVKSRKLTPHELLSKSITTFNQIPQLTAHYLPMRINRACAYHMMTSFEADKKELYMLKANEDLNFVQRYSPRAYGGDKKELDLLKYNASFTAVIISYSQYYGLEGKRTHRESGTPEYIDATLDGLNFAKSGSLEKLLYDWNRTISFADGVTVSGKQLPHSLIMRFKHGNNQFFLQRVDQSISDFPAAMKKEIFQVGSVIPEDNRLDMRKSIMTLQGDYFLIHDARGVVYQVGDDFKVKSWAIFGEG